MLLSFPLLGNGWEKLCCLGATVWFTRTSYLRSLLLWILLPLTFLPWSTSLEPRNGAVCLAVKSTFEISRESGLPFQGVEKVLARALSTRLFFQCGIPPQDATLGLILWLRGNPPLLWGSWKASSSTSDQVLQVALKPSYDQRRDK